VDAGGRCCDAGVRGSSFIGMWWPEKDRCARVVSGDGAVIGVRALLGIE
jgi:hypothetical protein